MTITLCVDELVLRPWAADDLGALIEAHQDPVLRRWTTLPAGNAVEARRWLDVQDHGWATGERLSFAVHDDRRMVGHVALKRAAAEVGYWTAAHARGRGVAPRALGALTTWAFDTFAGGGLKSLALLHQVGNVASCRVAEKAGYVLDRVLPAHPPAYPEHGHRHVRPGRP